jgi:hypothetical protein
LDIVLLKLVENRELKQKETQNFETASRPAEVQSPESSVPVWGTTFASKQPVGGTPTHPVLWPAKRWDAASTLAQKDFQKVP